MQYPTLLCVGNLTASAGYAWLYINELYAEVCRRAASKGIRTVVSYPGLEEEPAAFRDSPAELVEFPFRVEDLRGLYRTVRFVRNQQVRFLYLTDSPSWSVGYSLLRLSGVRRIVIHEHRSGEFDRPTGIKRILKRLRQLIPGSNPDVIVTVSDFVAERICRVDLVRRERVRRIWNSVRIQSERAIQSMALRDEFGVPADHLLVGCAARANDYKGVPLLIRAVQRLRRRGLRVVLLYFGDGPDLPKWREGLDDDGAFIFAGYRPDSSQLMAGVDIAVVPSLWAEAFGMAALEPMAHGVPVIASETGGLVEVVEHEETGLLVPPGDLEALSVALERLLDDASLRAELGRKGRLRAERFFSRERAVHDLMGEVLGGYAAQGSGRKVRGSLAAGLRLAGFAIARLTG